VDLIGEVNSFIVSRMANDLTKIAKQKGGDLGWTELSLANELLYPLQPKLPSKDENNRPVPPTGPFDFLNIRF